MRESAAVTESVMRRFFEFRNLGRTLRRKLAKDFEKRKIVRNNFGILQKTYIQITKT